MEICATFVMYLRYSPRSTQLFSAPQNLKILLFNPEPHFNYINVISSGL